MEEKKELKLSGKLPLDVYWQMSAERIADKRGWGTIKRSPSSEDAKEARSFEERREASIKNYMRAMDAIKQFLPDKSMAELSAFELLKAIKDSRNANGKTYSDSTLQSRLSLLRDIYDYAQDCGHACNDLHFVADKQLSYYMKALDLPLAERKQLAKKIAQESGTKARSLTSAQQAELVRVIHEKIEEDGRYLMLAIMLYTGMRPSECRGLNWCDFIQFCDCPDRHMLSVVRQRDNENNPVDRLKRPSSYRKIGVHFELEQIIQRRLNFVLKRYSSFEEIKKLPLCCYENVFDQGCTRTQLSTFAVKVLKDSIRVKNEVMEYCAMDMLAYEDNLLPEDAESVENLQVCTYLLRHDFWTWMQASTELTDQEKRYYFGHSLFDGRNDKRPEYNNEDVLLHMLLKLDHMVKYAPLHEPLLHGTIFPEGCLSAPDKGCYTLHLSPELLRTGGHVKVILTANERDDPIFMRTISPTKPVFTEGPLQIRATVFPRVEEDLYRTRINMDYENWVVR